MYGRHCSQAIPSFAINVCVLATKLHMLNFYEACAAICCDCDLREPITQDTKIYSVLEKKAKITTKIERRPSESRWFSLNTGCAPQLTYLQIQKNLAINLIAYGNRQNAITFARAINSDLLWALKHLIETRLMLKIYRYLGCYIQIFIICKCYIHCNLCNLLYAL